jgi:hypothetical protein
MKPIEFPEQNHVWGVPPGAEDRILPLPCWVEWMVVQTKNGPRKIINMTLSKWELTDEEIAFVVKNRFLWLKQVNGGNPLQPQWIHAGEIEFPATLAFSEVFYQSQTSLKGIWAYVNGNFDPPSLINLQDELYSLSDKYKARLVPGKALGIDDYFFRMPTQEEAEERAAKAIAEFQKGNAAELMLQEERESIIHEIKKGSISVPILCQKKQAGGEVILC